MTATAETTRQPPAKAGQPMVGMGQIAVIMREESAYAVLGSCIGLTLYSQRLRIGAMAHIVLPQAGTREGAPGKFADTALPHMLKLLQEHQVYPSGLTAKVAGGASMFAATGKMQIGDANLEAVRSLLQEKNIPIAGEHVGGTKGRRVTFDGQTGLLTVDRVGESTETI